MATADVSYNRLARILIGLGFVESRQEGKWKAYRNADRDVLVVWPDRPGDERARQRDLASVRRHLVENGLISSGDFDRFLQEQR